MTGGTSTLTTHGIRFRQNGRVNVAEGATLKTTGNISYDRGDSLDTGITELVKNGKGT
ncbi:MAG: hypothetical protein Q4C70_12995 [Planctomycetia bacterium]|nr:hypothetical protein [Planctomycetia bacterium]